jgi:hypothetical protein
MGVPQVAISSAVRDHQASGGSNDLISMIFSARHLKMARAFFQQLLDSASVNATRNCA